MPRIRGEFIAAEDLPYGPGNTDYEYDAARQEEVDAEQEAFSEGQRAGMLGLTAGLNPYDHNTTESTEWERARAAIIAARLSQSLRRDAA